MRNLGLVPLGLFGLWLAYLRTRHLDKQHEQTERGQITDRYAKAVEMLGNETNVSVRIGGLYALKQIAKDSEQLKITAREIIENFVRNPTPYIQKMNDNELLSNKGEAVNIIKCTDIHVALSVLQYLRKEGQIINLSCANLGSFDLRNADFSGFNLSESHLSYSVLQGADFNSSKCINCNFNYTYLISSDFTQADISSSTFIGSNIGKFYQDGAYFRNTKVQACNFSIVSDVQCILQDAWCWEADDNIDQTDPIFPDDTEIPEDFFLPEILSYHIYSNKLNEMETVIKYLEKRRHKKTIEAFNSVANVRI